MALASLREQAASRSKPKRPSTAHLKVVPQKRALRDQIRAEATSVMQGFDRTSPLSRALLQTMGEELLERMGLEEKYLGFVLVMLSNEFWRDQLMAVDFSRRLFLMSTTGLLACPSRILAANPREPKSVSLSSEHHAAVNRRRRIVVQ